MSIMNPANRAKRQEAQEQIGVNITVFCFTEAGFFEAGFFEVGFFEAGFFEAPEIEKILALGEFWL